MRTPRSRAAPWCLALVLALNSFIASAAMPTPLLAQSIGFAATTQATARRQGVVVVSGITWTCTGSLCTTAATPSANLTMAAACQSLGREVGPIASFAVAKIFLSSPELQQCNTLLSALAAGVRLTIPGPANPPAAAAASRSYPVRIRTADLTATGTGVLATFLPFAPRSIRTEVLTVTGTGMLATFLPFASKSIRTDVLTVTGTGVIR